MQLGLTPLNGTTSPHLEVLIIYRSRLNTLDVCNPHSADTIPAGAGAAAAAKQVWYRFVMQLGLYPLNGTTSSQHMRDDLQVEQWQQSLSEHEMRDIGRVIGEQL